LLEEVNFTVSEPGLVCILGPNGVGKTTLVKCMNRLLRPCSGTVAVDGQDVQQTPLIDLARRMAYVPNSMLSVFSMSVTDAVLLGRHPHSGWMTSDRDLVVTENVMRTMELEALADRNIRELSAGQNQRVMIARGLAQEPEILILDEPTSSLDVRYQMETMAFLRSYASERGIITIVVCHDLNITSAFADRIMMLSGGGVYADGPAGSVITEDNIREVYDVDSRVIDVEGRPHVILLPRKSNRKEGF
jgi:iron complex transport system ATP-binding protein